MDTALNQFPGLICISIFDVSLVSGAVESNRKALLVNKAVVGVLNNASVQQCVDFLLGDLLQI